MHRDRFDARGDDRGLRRAGTAAPGLGIDASATIEKTRAQVARIARHTAQLIGLGRELRDDEITVLEGWAGDLYGVPVESTLEAMRLGARLEAMITDPVYEGKSLAGLIDLVTTGTSRGQQGALRASRRPARAECIQRAVPLGHRGGVGNARLSRNAPSGSRSERFVTGERGGSSRL